MHFYRFFSTLIAALLLLNGCDFHLRGYPREQTLPFYALHLKSNTPYTSFDTELHHALKALGVNVADPAVAQLTLQILSQNFSRTTTSLGNVGQTTTYLLSFSVRFQLTGQQHQIVLPAEEIRSTRNFSITSNQVNGDLNTQNELQKAMQRDIVQQLITRLSSPVLYKRVFPSPSR